MKHNSDPTDIKQHRVSQMPLLYCLALLLVIVLFSFIALVIGKQIFSRVRPSENVDSISSSLAQLDSQVDVKQEGKLSASRVPSHPSVFAQLSNIIDGLDRLATAILKISCSYLLIEGAMFLIYYRNTEDKHRQRGKKKVGQKKRETSGDTPKRVYDVEKDHQSIRRTETEQPLSSFDRQGATQITKQSPSISAFSDTSITHIATQTCEITGDSREHKQKYQMTGQQEELVYFDFQDESKALEIMKGDVRQGPIYFKELSSGPLEGSKVDDICYSVCPKMQEITESEINYSAIRACFEIDKNASFGKRFRIRVNQPAYLAKGDGNIYSIFKKGKLAVTDTIE